MSVSWPHYVRARARKTTRWRACQLRAALRAERALLLAGAAVARAHDRLREPAPEGRQAAEEVGAGEAHHGEELRGTRWLSVLGVRRAGERSTTRGPPSRSRGCAAHCPSSKTRTHVCGRAHALGAGAGGQAAASPGWAAPTSSRLFCSGVPVSRTRRLARSASSESMVLLPPADLRRCPSSQTCRAAAAPWDRDEKPSQVAGCALTASSKN